MEHKRIKKPWKTGILKSTLMTLIVFILIPVGMMLTLSFAAMGYAFFQSIQHGTPFSPDGIITQMSNPMLNELIMLLALFTCSFILSVRHDFQWREILLPRQPLQWLILPVILLFAGMSGLASQLGLWVQLVLPMSEEWIKIMESMVSPENGFGWTFLSIAVMAPLLEEIFFRGMICRGLARRYKPWVAITVSALLFAVAHMNPWQGVGAFVIGLLMGWMTLRTGSVLPAILAHAVNNGLAVFSSYQPFGIPGYDGATPDNTVFLPWWFLLLCAFLVLAGWWGVTRQKAVPGLWEQPIPPVTEVHLDFLKGVPVEMNQVQTDEPHVPAEAMQSFNPNPTDPQPDDLPGSESLPTGEAHKPPETD